ncbi:MAG: hypothetical protein HY367_03990 [Candidatus Aenigmarchaeota archaeon]|nr:hypothetical protein [Candidatus Aenigmarchaeota archaeon]
MGVTDDGDKLIIELHRASYKRLTEGSELNYSIMDRRGEAYSISIKPITSRNHARYTAGQKIEVSLAVGYPMLPLDIGIMPRNEEEERQEPIPMPWSRLSIKLDGS